MPIPDETTATNHSIKLKIISGAARVVETVWEYRDRLFPRSLWILVIGPSGAGKTHLVRRLFGLPTFETVGHEPTYDVENVAASRDSFVATMLRGRWTRISARDTPGEDLQRYKRDEIFYKGLEGRVPIVLHVVANGFHQNRTPRPTAIFEEGGIEAIIPRYQKDCLKREVNDLKGFLRVVRKPTRFLTVVNKADLWGADLRNRQDVVALYDRGAPTPYGRQLDDLPRDTVYKALAYAVRSGDFYGVRASPGLDEHTLKGLQVELEKLLVDWINHWLDEK